MNTEVNISLNQTIRESLGFHDLYLLSHFILLSIPISKTNNLIVVHLE